jgi:hypothetical protein
MKCPIATLALALAACGDVAPQTLDAAPGLDARAFVASSDAGAARETPAHCSPETFEPPALCGRDR